jgi:dTMP kinase
MTLPRGKFITFEGGEGTGKSTQAKILAEALRARGREIVLTREPGGSPGAEDIRRLLVTGEAGRWEPLSETLLFLAARSDHVARVIGPALKKGAWVVCDRFTDSTFVYQGVARGLGVAAVRALQAAVPGIPAPDLTFILDLDPTIGLERAGRRSDTENRFEGFDADFHDRLRAAFRDIASTETPRCSMVDASLSPDEVAKEIWNTVHDRLAP